MATKSGRSAIIRGRQDFLTGHTCGSCGIIRTRGNYIHTGGKIEINDSWRLIALPLRPLQPFPVLMYTHCSGVRLLQVSAQILCRKFKLCCSCSGFAQKISISLVDIFPTKKPCPLLTVRVPVLGSPRYCPQELGPESRKS